MRRILHICIVVLLLLALAGAARAETKVLQYPGAVHKLVLRSEKLEEYNRLANSIGFVLLKEYSYTEYVDIKRENKVGSGGGEWDWLLLSTGGNEWDLDASKRFFKQPARWETTYYANHDLTVIHEERNDPDGTHSWVRILKVAEGRRPDLHEE